MPHKMMSMLRAQTLGDDQHARPILLAIAGDSAAGKTTLTKGLLQALGPERVTAVCVDDYHRYDRVERRTLPFTPLHPDCNHVDIMEQHLQLLATGQPILKPVYDHSSGTLARPRLVEPREFVIIEGLLPLHTRLSRACFDVTVFLDPPEEIRKAWKVERDCARRGYAPDEVLAELERREPESAAFIRPQRAFADIVVRFAPVEGIDPGAPLSATVLLRPTIQHPDLSSLLTDETRRALHLKLVRDADGKPVDALHIHGHAPRPLIESIEEHICGMLGIDTGIAARLGYIDADVRSEPLAVTQLVLLYHMLLLARTGAAARAGSNGATELAGRRAEPVTQPE
jgi:phosphoribulokinase